MTEIEQAIASLKHLVECRCDEAYTGRGRHESYSACDYADEVKIVADHIDEIGAQLKMVLAREAETQARHDSKIDALNAKLAKAVEDAFCEGFAEGCDGTWVEGDYTHAWKKSHALANLEKAK
tara:strand:+ start:7021 stop:7389 length:369 start_codon:yes stop_codon:yes gene_type:complete